MFRDSITEYITMLEFLDITLDKILLFTPPSIFKSYFDLDQCGVQPH